MGRSIGILQLRIALEGIEPAIWRRILVPSEITFFELHKIIQRAMGWKDCHQHQFISNSGGPLKPSQEKVLRIGQSAKAEGACFRYEYDFGDGWNHFVLIEKILPPDDRGKSPVCLAGARACPPEDCGGVPGYEELLEILADPSHPERAERLKWLGSPFDAAHFDLAATNKKLARFTR
jgi:hypothetical protein